MDSLLCSEEWLNSPSVEHNKLRTDEPYCPNSRGSFFYTTVEDREEALRTFLGKEVVYMPEPGYLNHVKSDSLVENARFKGICWIIKSQRRLNLSLETVFCAANYIDRFISLKQCRSWKHWVFELLAVACLSVASKYNETITPSFHDIQMEGLEYSFESELIQRMELTLMKALQWRLSSITSYSFVELLARSIDPVHKHGLPEEFTASVTKRLLNALLDSKFVEFRPSIIAMSALVHTSKEFLLSSTNMALLNSFSALIHEDKKDDLSKCSEMMDEYDPDAGSIFSCPSSPVTVLATQYYNSSDFQVHLSLLKIRKIEFDLVSGKKRKSPEKHDECLRSSSGEECVSNQFRKIDQTRIACLK